MFRIWCFGIASQYQYKFKTQLFHFEAVPADVPGKAAGPLGDRDEIWGSCLWPGAAPDIVVFAQASSNVRFSLTLSLPLLLCLCNSVFQINKSFFLKKKENIFKYSILNEAFPGLLCLNSNSQSCYSSSISFFFSKSICLFLSYTF